MVNILRKKWKYFFSFLIFFVFSVSLYYGGILLNKDDYNNWENLDKELLKQENERLKKEIEELGGVEGDYKIAKIIYRDMYSFFDEIILNIGSDEVKEGDAVVSSEGLIGIIKNVSDSRCIVSLLTGDYKVSVKVGEYYGTYNNGNIELLDKYADIKEGELVYTSGIGYLKEGLYVGKVVQVLEDKNNLGKIVKVEVLDSTNLRYVGVIET